MLIIGIDPGSRKTGYGLVEFQTERGNRIVHVDHGIVYLDVRQELPERMAELAHRLCALLKIFSPQKAVLENVFVGSNVRSALILGQARGVALASLGLNGISTANLNPTEVKMAVTGNGHASKIQIKKMVQILLKLEKAPAEDAADALALAICEANRTSSPQHMKSKKGGRAGLYELALAQGKI